MTTTHTISHDDIVFHATVKRAGETLWTRYAIPCPQCHQPFLTNQAVSMRMDYLAGDDPLHCYVHTPCADAYNQQLVDAEFDGLKLPARPPTYNARTKTRALMFGAMVDICQARRTLDDHPNMSPAGVALWERKELEAQVLLAALGNMLGQLEEWNDADE